MRVQSGSKSKTLLQLTQPAEEFFGALNVVAEQAHDVGEF
ncbi:MAG: hypothetical protein ACI8QZ_000002 [Chlamydiales bacterium]|jgi:hypothetical protein